MIDRQISKAVITGPTGGIGTALCMELAQNGVQVFAVCRPGSQRAGAIGEHPNITRVFCDAGQLEQLPQLIPGGADAFYHFAWTHTIGPGRNDIPAQIENIRYTVEAVRAAAAMGCKVFLGAGSQAEYGRVEGLLTPATPCFPENGYGMAKLCAGQMSRLECQKLGLDHIWTRILSIYGPGDGPNTMISGVIAQLLRGEKPALTQGIQKWDYLYSGDAARAFRLIARHGVSGSVYPLGSGEARQLREYICILRDQIDARLPLGFGEIPYSPLQVMHLQADITTLRADTGFSPSTSFESGIIKTIASMKEKV